jgi:hypothetical protein
VATTSPILFPLPIDLIEPMLKMTHQKADVAVREPPNDVPLKAFSLPH